MDFEKKFTQQANTLEKWTLTPHLQLLISGNFETMIKLGGTQNEITPQTIKPRKNKKIIQELKYELVNICSGAIMLNKDIRNIFT